MEDKLNPKMMFNMMSTELLVKAVNGEINLLDLAKRQLASRGLDKQGAWVGFDRAKEIHKVK